VKTNCKVLGDKDGEARNKQVKMKEERNQVRKAGRGRKLNKKRKK